jgi:mRNA interferase MazF
VYSVATGSGFGGKPRPAIVVQGDPFMDFSTVLVALVADAEHEAALVRPVLEPDVQNGLTKRSIVAADTLVTVRNKDFGQRIGTLSDADLRRLDLALLLILGLTE